MADIWLGTGRRKTFPGYEGGTFSTTQNPKCVIHQTETGAGLPAYQGGAVAPNLTVIPVPGVGVEVVEHMPINRSSRALRNSAGGVETNTAAVTQVELAGTCDRTAAAVHGWFFWPAADDQVLLDLWRKVIEPIARLRGIPLRCLPFVAYPASYGTSNGVRLNRVAWLAYSGFLGHQHVPENVHGDGQIPWDRMVQLATQPATPEEDMPLTQADAELFARVLLTTDVNRALGGSTSDPNNQVGRLLLTTQSRIVTAAQVQAAVLSAAQQLAPAQADQIAAAVAAKLTAADTDTPA